MKKNLTKKLLTTFLFCFFLVLAVGSSDSKNSSTPSYSDTTDSVETEIHEEEPDVVIEDGEIVTEEEASHEEEVVIDNETDIMSDVDNNDNAEPTIE